MILRRTPKVNGPHMSGTVFRSSMHIYAQIIDDANGKTIAAGVRYGIVKAWDVESGKETASLTAHDGDAWAVSFTPDGKTLVSGGGDWGKPGTVKLWDTKTWKERERLKHTNEVLCVAFHPNRPIVAAGAWDKTVRVWDLTELLKAEK